MAERRMFSKAVIDSDTFLDMPLTAQAFYFHLSMRADDDGFVNNPKKIQRMTGCSDDDVKILLAKSFVIPFESGICVIRHWKIHNYIQKDRYRETVYQSELQALKVGQDNAYSLMDTECIQDVSKMDTQVRLGKVRLELGKSISSSAEPPSAKFSDDSDEMKLSLLLAEHMKRNNPNCKLPKDYQGWCKHIDLMIRIDKRTPKQIQDVIVFCQQDTFWSSNILSTKKLREKFDQLSMKAASGDRASSGTESRWKVLE